MLAQLSDALADRGISDSDRLRACETFLLNVPPDDAVRPEVMALRTVFASQNPVERASAITTYFRDYDRGQFARNLGWLRDMAGEASAFDAVMTDLRTLPTKDAKAKACKSFIDRFPMSAKTKEVALLFDAYGAKYADDESNAWLRYRLECPNGAMKHVAGAELRRSESWILMQLRGALSSGAEKRFVDIAGVHKEIFSRSQSLPEIRSTLNLLRAEPSQRIELAERHLRSYGQGQLTMTIRELIKRWRADEAQLAVQALVQSYDKAESRTERAAICKAFMEKYPRSKLLSEVRAAMHMVSLSSAKARLEAVRKYVGSYPNGLFGDAARKLETEYLDERENELYQSVTMSLADSRMLFTARVTSCERYLEEYPQGAHADEVRRAKQSVLATMEEEKAAYEELMRDLPRIASFEEAIKRCDVFLAKYAAGTHVTEVNLKIQELRRRMAEREEADAYKELTSRIRNPSRSKFARADECLAFLRRYGRGPHREDVAKELTRLVSVSLGPHVAPVRAAAFDAKSDYLVTSDAHASVRRTGEWVWTLPDGQLTKRWQASRGFTVQSMSAGPDDTMWFGEASGGVSTWKILDGSVEDRTRLGRASIEAVSARSNGGAVLTASLGDSKARLWQYPDWDLIGGFACPGGVSAAALSPGGDAVAVGSRSGLVAAYRAGGGPAAWSDDSAHGGTVDCVVFDSGGSLLASASKADRQVRLWGSLSGTEIWRVEEEATSLAFVGADLLATGRSLRSCSDGRVVEELGGAGPVAVSPDGRYLLTGSEENMVRVWYLPALLRR